MVFERYEVRMWRRWTSVGETVRRGRGGRDGRGRGRGWVALFQEK